MGSLGGEVGSGGLRVLKSEGDPCEEEENGNENGEGPRSLQEEDERGDGLRLGLEGGFGEAGV